MLGPNQAFYERQWAQNQSTFLQGIETQALSRCGGIQPFSFPSVKLDFHGSEALHEHTSGNVLGMLHL